MPAAGKPPLTLTPEVDIRGVSRSMTEVMLVRSCIFIHTALT